MKVKTNLSSQEFIHHQELLELFQECPIGDEILRNLGVFLTRQSLSKILFLDTIYRKIIDTQGVVIEFGTRWGQNTAVFSVLREIYEPSNFARRIIGFDTYKGYTVLSAEDGQADIIKLGSYGVTDKYSDYLEKIMKWHNDNSLTSHIKKYEIIEGDVIKTFPVYLRNNSHTVIALAYFDLDLYLPTKSCLEQLLDGYMAKGGILVFDELNNKDYPGETKAVRELLKGHKIRCSKLTPHISYIEW